jgi:hypothetical protein
MRKYGRGGGLGAAGGEESMEKWGENPLLSKDQLKVI